FIDGALDRADALRDDAPALAVRWARARIVLLDDDGRALADAQWRLLAPTGDELGGGPGTAIFLGLRDSVAWFAQRAGTANAQVRSEERRVGKGRRARWRPRQ